MIPAIQEVNFPSYATLHQATVSLQDMGDRVISTQVRIDGDIVPDFSGWELRFKGERFVLPSDNPQAVKDNTTRNSLVDLQFQSWPIQELKRYYFFEAASVSAGVAIADKYISSVRLDVEDFVVLLNQVLNYYFDGKIVADLYLSGTGIYSQEKKDVEINYSFLWDVIGKIFEIYGVRNRIEYNSSTDVYTIKIGYPTTSIDIDDHDFEYGYQGGLLKFERQVQDENIQNILLGRGGEKNLPYRYFKKTDPDNPDWTEDPDAIPELANIYFDRLRDINFRWYVRGWMHNPNRDTSGDEDWDPGHVFPTYTISSTSPYYWAYQKGLTDTQFNPVEFVKDDDSIEAFGEHWGALDDNDDIYPTIQGRGRVGIGRIDEVVAVSPITTDDIEAAAATAAIEKSINPLLVAYPRSNNASPLKSEDFEIPTGQTGNITYAWVGPTSGTGIHIDTTQSTLVAVDSSGNEHPISGLSAGTYHLELVISLYVPSGQTASGTFGMENIKLTTSAQDTNSWKPTFDIWVKDIWGIERETGETDLEYSLRVWGPILGDRAGNEAKVVFSTGFMSISEDYEFVIADYPVPDTTQSYNNVPSAWKITLRKSDAEYEATGLYIPNNTSSGKPVAGDKFFFTGIDMPFMYVTMAEEEVNSFKSGNLQNTAAVNPTWVISLDKVRVHTLEDGEYGQTLADRLAAGAKLWITDPRFSNGQRLQLYAQSITYTWNEPSDNSPYIVPDIEVVLSDTVVSRETRMDKVEGSVQEIKAQYARLDDVERVVRSVAEPMFLKKTGEADSSESPTQFSSKVSSKGFRQGGVGGSGWGFYRDNTAEVAEGEDGEGDAVLEVDRMVVRKEMQVNSLVVNQVDYRGGMEVISAAEIVISKVIDDTTNGRYVCYFDQKQNSVANNFVVGDVAFGQVFTPNNNTLRYYKCKVEAVDVDRVELSKTIKDGAGVPQAGDVLVQYGNYTNTDRQYVIVRDVVGGGYERMIDGLSSVSASGNEYYFAGRQSGQYYNKPRWFVGSASGEYAEYTNDQLNIKGRFSVRKSDGTYVAMSTYIENNDVAYLKAATNDGTTLVDGGLILTNLMALGQTVSSQFQINAGINGIMNAERSRLGGGVAAWFGGIPSDKDDLDTGVTDYAKSIFRFDGSGYLAGGKIHWDSSGYGGIPGITWSRPSGSQTDVITIGANVMLEQTGGTDSSVTDLITMVRSVSNMFEDESYQDGNITKHRIRVKSGFEGLYTNGFLSAGGVSSGGGASGTTLAAVWDSLEGNSGDYAGHKIDPAHLISTGSATGGIHIGSGLDWSNGVLSAIGAVTSVVGQTGDVTAQQISTALGLGAAATYGIGSVASGDTGLVTGGAVWSAIDALPEPMVFKGSLGTGGTITTLPTASSANEGYTYKVITDGTYAGQTAKVGDLFISNGSAWIWIPSGDEPSGTVTSVGLSMPTGFSVSSSPITTSGTLSVSFASGYSLLTSTQISTWNAKYDKPSGGIPNTDLVNSSITIGSTSISLGGSSLTLAGLTSVTAGKFYLNANTYFEIDSNGYVHLVHPSGKGFYADGFISAGGISSGGGTSGIDLAAMWSSLQNNDIGASGPAYEHRNDKFHLWHMPTAGTGITYTTDANNLVTGISINSSEVASALSGNWLPQYRYTSANPNLDTMSDGWNVLASSAYGPTSNNGILIQDTDNGTPFQIWIPDVGYYMWKRYNTSTIGGTWTKMYAGHADSAASLSVTHYAGNLAISTTSTLTATPTFGCVDVKDGTPRFRLVNSSANILGYFGYVSNVLGNYIELHNLASGSGLVLLNTDAITMYWQTSSTLYPFYHSGNLTKSVVTTLIGSTTYAPYNANGYLPLTGGTIEQDVVNPLNINNTGITNANGVIEYFRIGGTTKAAVGYTGGSSGMAFVGYEGTNFPKIGVNYAGVPQFWTNSDQTQYNLYHSGNSNTTSVAWNASSLTLNGAISGATNIDSRLYFNTSTNSSYFYCGDFTLNVYPSLGALSVGTVGLTTYNNTYGLYAWTNLWITTSFLQAGWANGTTSASNIVLQYLGGNVGIGPIASPAYTLDVAGVIHATTGILSDGYITAGSASSREFKDNVQNMSLEYARNIIMSSRPITFRWNALAYSLCDKYEGDGIGFIAQEAEQLMPFAVSPIFEKYKRLDYTAYVSPLVRMSQYLLTTTDNHETRIQQLENRVKELEDENGKLKARLTN